MDHWSTTEEQLRTWEIEAGYGLASTITVCELIDELRRARETIITLQGPLPGLESM